MFSLFFIDRPKFAFVISIVITLAGLLSIPLLPIAEFPDVTPPVVNVSTSYPGADAETVRDTIATPIEAELNGVEGAMYMSSNSANDGTYSLNVTFEVGSDPDMAQVRVQNLVQQAIPKLPEETSKQGVNVNKQSTSMTMIVNLFSPEETHDGLFLSNYASLSVTDALARINGVSKVTIMGALDYGMRIWLNPDRMASLNLTVQDILNSVREQNVQVAAGQVGAPPSPSYQQFQYTLRTTGRLTSVEDFENIILIAREDGSSVRLKDVARLELGSQSYASYGKLDNRASTVIAIYQLPEANALDISEAVSAEMEKLKESFPKDIDYGILYDTTKFVDASIKEVAITLFQALILVVLVVYLFLQDVRSTLIPAIAIPVSLIGTFAVLFVTGMSINTVTLFALILAIGVVVDDAIVVIENVQRHMDDGLSPKEATREAMKEVFGPVIATTLVLLAVFVPVALMPGITGQMYAQFAVTISIAVIISSINALTLSPALCATVLKPNPPGGEKKKGRFFTWFEATFSRLTGGYVGWVRILVRRVTLVVALLALILGGTGFLFKTLPTGFIPPEDKGAFMIDIALPDGASLQRTEEVLNQVTDIINTEEGVAHAMTVSGYSILKGAASSNAGLAIVVLDSWDERPTKELHMFSILQRIQAKLYALPDANIFAFPLPAIPGIGATGGFEFVLEDTMGRPPSELAGVMRTLILKANESPEIDRAFSSFRADVPQVFIDVDRVKARNLGIPLNDVFMTMQSLLGSLYINDFNKFGKVYRVMMMADAEYRSDVRDIDRFYVRSQNNEMIPLGTLIETKPILGPEVVTRYNLFASANINGSAAPGYSSGQAIAAMERIAAEELPDGYAFEWTGMTYQELAAGNLAPLLFSLAIIFVYLFLVAQYESWSIPLSVMFAVPIAILGALLAVAAVGMAVNLYTQIGLVLLIGLSTKSAILIVEFAKNLREEEGLSVWDAAIKAAELRFRAVLMTGLSFVLGVIPLVLSTGAGAMSRLSLGFAVLGGMTLSVIVATLLVPAFYVIIQRVRERFKGAEEAKES
ncbi:efflux RND transporter permease subunit [Alkalimarinus sediminis]|uniref:Efflux pump membrane transporter n=1 Tax=Alkalimarinus sediminis TaxID=1632866 RepID=A0A9E8HNS0_9ALTE|nr:multidrug efflux RND transporter permease subunit [Alkalimarinus sediminis]UZW76647.1 multidrug efflux RND transporter permease subunit [Alkalimarinus sediminis]